MMSVLDPRPDSVTITTRGTVDPADPYGDRAGQTTTTAACRAVREQKQHRQDEGDYETSQVTLYDLPAGTSLPELCTVQLDGVDYRVIRWREDQDAYGQTEGITAWLG